MEKVCDDGINIIEAVGVDAINNPSLEMSDVVI